MSSSPSFGRLLRRFRTAAGLTQEQLAEQAGLSARAVSDLERDDARVPRRATVDLLATALALGRDERAALMQTIRRARSTPASGTAAASDAPPTAPALLPAPPTVFIGRDQEVGRLTDLLGEPTTRLLTLTGPGGVGKTRLALALGAARRVAVRDGVVFVPLAAITDPALVVPTIVRHLGAREVPGEDVTETLARLLASKQMLLILDNMEQVLPAAVPIAALVAACPALTILVTSRTPLRVRGERTYRVPPLAVPARRPSPPPEMLSQYDAVRLFIARARDVRSDFAVTNETAPAVAEMCARLDGLPLAIELAAARVRLLPPEALLARLATRLALLTGGARDAPARHQTLRATIDWSYELLDREQRVLFARLAVFAGGGSLEAVEAVCARDGEAPLAAMDQVEALLDNSLLQRAADESGEPRVSMLETIHEYAWERLEEAHEAHLMQERHAHYYAALAERAEPAFHGPAQGLWLDRLEREHDNIRAAVRWSIEADRLDLGLRLAGTVWPFWWLRGYLPEGRGWLDTLLEQARSDRVRGPEMDAQAATRLRAKALYGAGMLACYQGDFTRGVEHLTASHALWLDAGDAVGAASALIGLGRALQWHGAVDRAGAALDDGLALARLHGAGRHVAAALHFLGSLALVQGQTDRAVHLLEEALTIHEAHGDTSGYAQALLTWGEVARAQGDLHRASALYTECLALLRQTKNEMMVPVTLGNLGIVARLQGDLAQAELLGTDAVIAAWAAGNRWTVAYCLEALAAVACLRKQGEHAAWLLGAADGLRVALRAPLPAHELAAHTGLVADVRAAMGDDAYAAAWRRGRAERLEVIIDDVVQAAGAARPDPPTGADTGTAAERRRDQ